MGIKISPIQNNIDVDVSIDINEYNKNSNDNLSKKCNICLENYNCMEELNNCGNKNCKYIMCDTCIVKLNTLSIENRILCPVCKVKMSKEIINKQNKYNDKNINISNNLISINNNLDYFKNLLNKIIKNTIEFFKLYLRNFILINCIVSLLLFLGNMLFIKLNIYLNIATPLYSYFINGILGGIFILIMIIIFLFFVINLFRCTEKFCL